jgi:hypothetical protein
MSASLPPRLRVRDIAWFERALTFRHPFRFGAVTVTGAPQVFLQVEIETEAGARALGVTAELMVPKWFDKNPALTPEQTVGELRRALVIARELYLAHSSFDTAFGLHAACHDAALARCAGEGIPGLAAAFGPAQIDKAVLDALLRVNWRDVFTGLRENIAGLDARLTPELDDASIAAYLESRDPGKQVMVRHTVGMMDAVESLAGIHRDTGCRYFKLKLSGDPAADRARLIAIAGALAGIDYRATLDANEQYATPKSLTTLCDALTHDKALAELRQRLLYIEQPLPRERTFDAPLGDLGRQYAFIVDEAESGYDTFPKALALGYRGISSKACKGLYKSLLNGVRAAKWTSEGRAQAFLAAEDLTCQAGLAVQQDTALLAFHGIAHAERNGHHYVDGFAATPPEEIRAFRNAHPDLYEERDGVVRLAIHDGALKIGSLSQAGFASGVDPHLFGVGQHTPHINQTRELTT